MYIESLLDFWFPDAIFLCVRVFDGLETQAFRNFSNLPFHLCCLCIVSIQYPTPKGGMQFFHFLFISLLHMTLNIGIIVYHLWLKYCNPWISDKLFPLRVTSKALFQTRHSLLAAFFYKGTKQCLSLPYTDCLLLPRAAELKLLFHLQQCLPALHPQMLF